MKKRVVITGMGVVSSIGLNGSDFWNSLMQGKSGVEKIEKFDTENFSVHIGADVKGFDPTLYFSNEEIEELDPFVQYALVATQEAVNQSGIDFSKLDTTRVGVWLGSGNGGELFTTLNCRHLYLEGPQAVKPVYHKNSAGNLAALAIAKKYGLYGPTGCISTACATGSNCIGEAMRSIQYGEADVMIAGGTEDPIYDLNLAGFTNIKALSRYQGDPQKACRPFDRNRDGFVMGSGSGVLVLEELEHAKKRGAVILAELIGYGYTTDSYHITAPDPEATQATNCIKMALEDASISPDEVDYISAHGTSTPFNDRMETMAIKKVFGEKAKQIPVSAIKSMTGHAIAASGALEFISCVYSMMHDMVPPTLNCDEPEEELDLDYVPHVARKHPVRVAISNSFGFGGHNVCLVVKKWQEGEETI